MSFAQELVSLPDRGDLSLLHGLLQLLEGFGRDQLLAPTLTYPALEKLLRSTLPVAREPPLTLTLTPTVAVSLTLGRLLPGSNRSRTSSGAGLLQEPEHPHALEEVSVTMALFEVLQLLEILLDYLWVAYLWHTFIMPSTKRNGITLYFGGLGSRAHHLLPSHLSQGRRWG